MGLTISDDLSWNLHVSDIIRKANKRMYFLILLRRAGIPSSDIICFYCTCIRPLLEYCAPVFHHAIPKYLSDDLQRIQKRALHIITPGNSYRENLACHGLRSLQSRRMCNQRMCSLFPPKHSAKYNLRHTRQFSLPRFRTERFKRSFIPAMCGILNTIP